MSCAAQDKESSTLIVEHQGFLRATITENLVFVYRSVDVSDDNDMYAPVLAIVGNREPVTRDLVPASEMVGGKAEWLLYDLNLGQL